MRKWLVLLLALAAVALGWFTMIRMPGKSFSGTPPPLSPEEQTLRAELMTHVQMLGGEIGERNVETYDKLVAAADYIERTFAAAGLQPRREGYDVRGKRCDNIEVEIPGTTREIFVVGAHYDSVYGCPGANDNGSGIAALLALAKRFAGKQQERTLRFVAFPNEEPVHFQTQLMGSWVYANRCKERNDPIAGMMSLETIGYFSDERGSQIYPLPGLGAIYPKTGNFIAFVGNVPSRALVRQAVGSFRKHAQLPSEGTALPAGIPGVAWSDHWAFWQHGYPGIMVTDTAPFRYPHYHRRSDTPEKLVYDPMTRLVHGLEGVISDLANPSR
jgi:hypothetical protein